MRHYVVVAMMIWLSALCNAQSADSIKKHQDVYVLPTGAWWHNTTDTTYYVIPRYRVERLMSDAILSDTLQVMLEERERYWSTAWQQCRNRLQLWMGATLASVAIAIVLIITRY